MDLVIILLSWTIILLAGVWVIAKIIVWRNRIDREGEK